MEVNQEISELEYEKQQALYKKGGVTLRDLKNAEITLLDIEYDMESSRLNLAKMSIEAPFSGIISNLPYFTRGTRVASGIEMVSIIDFNKLYLEAIILNLKHQSQSFQHRRFLLPFHLSQQCFL